MSGNKPNQKARSKSVILFCRRNKLLDGYLKDQEVLPIVEKISDESLKPKDVMLLNLALNLVMNDASPGVNQDKVGGLRKRGNDSKQRYRGTSNDALSAEVREMKYFVA